MAQIELKMYLPPEMLLEILRHLDASSLSASSAVCKYWRRIVAAEEEKLWRRLAEQHGYVSSDEKVPDGLSARTFYVYVRMCSH